MVSRWIFSELQMQGSRHGGIGSNNDPLRSYSRVPEGMFYKGGVITETDADTAFYQRLSQKVGHLMKSIFCMGRESKLKKVIASYPKRQESCAKGNTYGG